MTSECKSKPGTLWPKACSCERCVRKLSRSRKLSEMGRYNRIPVERGLAVLDDMLAKGYDGRAVASACGVVPSTGINWVERRRRGEHIELYHSACRALLTAKPPEVGRISSEVSGRKLRALARLGWGTPHIAADITSRGELVRPGLLTDLRAGRVKDVDVRVARAIDAAYHRLWLTPAPQDRSHNIVRNLAVRNNWPSPMQWEAIDRLDCKPEAAKPWGPRRSHVDESAVQRSMLGRIPSTELTRAERFEVVRRMLASGEGLNNIRRITGIGKPERYLPEATKRESA